MDYEVVYLEEKKVAGLSARTNNQAPDMGTVIGGLWENFYTSAYDKIRQKTNDKSLGIYTDYAGSEKDDYTILVGCEVESFPDYSITKTENQEEEKPLTFLTIPAGKYAKFIVHGDVHLAVAKFWVQLWKMDLPRSFTCDFEEYQNSSMEGAEIHIYISLTK